MVSFGLVSIPVKLFSASESSAAVRFNMLDKKTGSRVKQQYVNSKNGEPVERKDIVKGYEFTKGQFVMFEDDEYKALLEKSTQSIELTEFVPIESIDPIYFSKSYYLGPDKGGARPYKLLSKALQKSGRAALAKYAARGKMYLVMLRPMGDGLIMQQLYYADEVRAIGDVPLGEAEIKDAELDLAMQIVDQAVSDKFEPQKYEDEVRKRMLAAIERKVEGQEITEAPEEPQAQVIDLMEALKASLAKGERKPAKKAGTSKKKTTARKKAKRA